METDQPKPLEGFHRPSMFSDRGVVAALVLQETKRRNGISPKKIQVTQEEFDSLTDGLVKKNFKILDVDVVILDRFV